MSNLPSHVVALFFDEIRQEVLDKTSLMGQYGPNLHIMNPGVITVDRLAIFVHAKWPLNTKIENCYIKVIVPRVPDMEVPIEYSPNNLIVEDPSPFAGIAMGFGLNLRFPPLEVGDRIDVWLHVGDQRLPAGRLNILGPPAQGESQVAEGSPKRARTSRRLSGQSRAGRLKTTPL